jgi:hypothetical protein
MAAKKSSKPGAVKYFNDLKEQGYKNAGKAMGQFRKMIPRTPKNK